MHHREYYSKPLYYDIAFDFRNVPGQVDFLEKVFKKHTCRKVTSVLELACGPGVHAVEFARRGIRALGLDLSPDMVAYARQKAEQQGVKAEYTARDMRDFSLAQPVDLALLLMDSISYLLTGEDFVRHLRTLADNMTPGGIYFIEASHPADIFRGETKTRNSWTMARDGITVRTTFGLPEDSCDSITQVADTTVVVDVKEDGHEFRFTDKAPQRQYTFQELKALIELSGCFDLVDTFGDFKMDMPLRDGGGAWRMNLVLRRKPYETAL